MVGGRFQATRPEGLGISELWPGSNLAECLHYRARGSFNMCTESIETVLGRWAGAECRLHHLGGKDALRPRLLGLSYCGNRSIWLLRFCR